MRSRLLPAAILTLAFASPALAAIPEGDALKKFTSGGHVLGFDSSGYFTSNGTYALRVQFEGSVGSEPFASGAGAEQGTPSPSEQAPALEKVSYKDIWPGVDLVYDAPDGGIARSTWTVAPGVDPSLIQLAYNRPVRLTERGDLQIGFETGTITESAPIAWQVVGGEREPVEVAFARTEYILASLSGSASSRDLPLGLTPTLEWNTFLGGRGCCAQSRDTGSGVAVGQDGDLYVVGTSGASWNIGNDDGGLGNPLRGHAGNWDAYVAKIDQFGGLIWNTFLGADFEDQGQAITAAAGGAIYVAGTASSSWGSPVRGFQPDDMMEMTDAFVAKLDPEGNLLWNTFLGDWERDGASAIAVDEEGYVYVAGYREKDAFVAKLDHSGGRIWHTLLCGYNRDWIEGIAVGPGGVYVVGSSYADWGSPERAYSGQMDAFAAKLDASGNLVWNTFLGGSADDYGQAIELDPSGKVYVVGYSSATWGDPLRGYTAGDDIYTKYDAFVAQLDLGGNLLWNTFLGGSGQDQGYGVDVDIEGRIYVSGASGDTWGVPHVPHSGSQDAFLAKLDPLGSIVWNTFVGGDGNETSGGVALGLDRRIYILGESSASWGDPVRAHSTYGGADAFVARIVQSMCGNGLLEGAEECDDSNIEDGDCCSSTCEIEAAGVQCRASAGACDSPETCDGASPSCPADSFASAGTECRASTGFCDPAEQCTGSATSCPSDAYLPDGTECRGLAGVCDVAETCLSGACPSDNLIGAGVECRPSAGFCDPAEQCNGSDAVCPTDAYLPDGTECRGSAGVCDTAELCTSGTCPGDSFLSAEKECRASTGLCDPPEQCNGSDAGCPSDAYLPDGTECRGSAGVCDVAEMCLSGTCPADSLVSAGAACRGSTGFCDPGEQCTGSDATCPADDYLPDGTECRGSAGVCDVAETCASGACPEDGVASAGSACRVQAGPCDVAETCDGVGTSCPADLKSTSVCRTSLDECDLDEYCDGISDLCPADSGLPDTDTDGTCDAYDICPDDPDPSQADTDEDGLGDACDPCTGGILAYKPLLKATNFATAAGDDKLKYKAKLIFDDAVSISPQTQGFRLLVEDAGGDVLIDLDIPAGLYDPIARSGWIPTPNGKKFQYITKTPVDGMLPKVILKWNPKTANEVLVIVKGKSGDFADPNVTLPLKATVSLDPTDAMTSLCAEAEFPGRKPLPHCRMSGNGVSVTCK